MISDEDDVKNPSVKETGNGTGHIWSEYAQEPFGQSSECQRKRWDKPR